VLWCSELECGGLARNESVSVMTACGRGSLVVCVCVGVVSCISLKTRWVGLDGKWGGFCVLRKYCRGWGY
jgi:hypothetical protein